jgi:hypothetical protein
MGKSAKRTRISQNISKYFHIKKKKEMVKNDIYLILRPDKDEKAHLLFPNDKVVYLRYDKHSDLLMIEKYNNLSL